MKFLPLVWAGLWRKPWRAVLVFLSVVNAFLLFGLLQGFVGGLDRAAANARADVVITMSRVSQYEALPLAVGAAIRRLDTVRATTPVDIFQGYYQEPTQRIRAFGVDATQLPDAMPALEATPAELEAMRRTPKGALVSEDLAALRGWKVGQQIPLIAYMYVNEDGTKTWPVEIVGLYKSATSVLLKNAILMNFDYIDKARQSGRSTASSFIVRLRRPADAARTAATIDAWFKNSPNETRTAPESQFAVDNVKAIGDVGAMAYGVMGAVFFALLFSVGATMFQAVHERTSELAVLKVFGFTDRAVMLLLFAETILLFTVASVLGLELSSVAFTPIVKLVGFSFIQSGPVVPLGLSIAAVLAIVASLVPVIFAMRLRTADALAGR